MKKLTPERSQVCEFEGRLSNIISGIALLSKRANPVTSPTSMDTFLYNFIIASEETTSWYLSAYLKEEERNTNRIGISAFVDKKIVLGRKFITFTQRLTIGATSPDDAGFNSRFDYGIEINPSRRTATRISSEDQSYFDFKSNPLTSQFGFNNNMQPIDVLGSFSEIVSAAISKELIIVQSSK